MAQLAERVFPTVLEPLRSQADVRALVGDDELFDALTTRPLGELIESVTSDDTLRGIIATDALIGTFASMGESTCGRTSASSTTSSGVAPATGTCLSAAWGRSPTPLPHRRVSAGATIITGADVQSVDPSTGEVTWAGGSAGRGRATGRALVAGCAPTVLNRLLAAAGADPVETEADVEGAQLKVNLLLTRLPRLRDTAVDPTAAFAGTFHINEGYAQLEQAYAAAAGGRIPDLPPCEIYCHTLSDRSILGPDLAVEHRADADPLRSAPAGQALP